MSLLYVAPFKYSGFFFFFHFCKYKFPSNAVFLLTKEIRFTFLLMKVYW